MSESQCQVCNPQKKTFFSRGERRGCNRRKSLCSSGNFSWTWPLFWLGMRMRERERERDLDQCQSSKPNTHQSHHQLAPPFDEFCSFPPHPIRSKTSALCPIWGCHCLPPSSSSCPDNCHAQVSLIFALVYDQEMWLQIQHNGACTH